MASPDVMGIGNHLNLIYYSINQNVDKLFQLDPLFTAPNDWDGYTITLLDHYLHELQFPINYQRPSSIFEGATILMYAARYKRVRIVQYLIQNNADTTLHHLLLAQYNVLSFALAPYDLQYDEQTVTLINLLLSHATPILPTAYSMFFLITRPLKLTPAYMNVWDVLWSTDPHSIDIRAISIFFSRKDTFNLEYIEFINVEQTKNQPSTSKPSSSAFSTSFRSNTTNINFSHLSSTSATPLTNITRHSLPSFYKIFQDIFSTRLCRTLTHKLILEQTLYIAFTACILADTINIQLLKYFLSLAPPVIFNTMYQSVSTELFKNNPFPIGWHHYPQIQDIFYEHAEPIECYILHHPMSKVIDEMKLDADGDRNIFTILLTRHAKQLDYTVLQAIEILFHAQITPPSSMIGLLHLFDCATLHVQLGVTILHDISNNRITYEHLFATAEDYVKETTSIEDIHSVSHDQSVKLASIAKFHFPPNEILRKKFLLQELEQRIKITARIDTKTCVNTDENELKQRAVFDIVSEKILADILIKSFLLIFSAYPQTDYLSTIILILTNIRSLPVDVSLYLLLSQNLFSFASTDILTSDSDMKILGLNQLSDDYNSIHNFSSPMDDFLSGYVVTHSQTQTKGHSIGSKVASRFHLLTSNSQSAIKSLDNSVKLLTAFAHSNQPSFSDALTVLEFLYSYVHVGGFSIAGLERRLFRLKDSKYTPHFKSIYHQFYTIHKLALFLPSSSISSTATTTTAAAAAAATYSNIAALFSSTSEKSSPIAAAVSTELLSFQLIGPFLFNQFLNNHISNDTFIALLDFIINHQDIVPLAHGDVLIPHVPPTDPKSIYSIPINGMRHFSIPTVTSRSRNDISMIPLINVDPSSFAYRLWLYVRYCERDAYLQYELAYSQQVQEYASSLKLRTDTPTVLIDTHNIVTTPVLDELWRECTNHTSGRLSNWYNIERLFKSNQQHHELDIYCTLTIPLNDSLSSKSSVLYDYYMNRTIYPILLPWGDISLLTRYSAFAFDPVCDYVYYYFHSIMIKSLRYIAQSSFELRDFFIDTPNQYYSDPFLMWTGLSEYKSSAMWDSFDIPLLQNLSNFAKEHHLINFRHYFPQIIDSVSLLKQQENNLLPSVSTYIPPYTPSIHSDLYYESTALNLIIPIVYPSPESHSVFIAKLHNAQQYINSNQRSLQQTYLNYFSLPGNPIIHNFISTLCADNPHIPGFLSIIKPPSSYISIDMSRTNNLNLVSDMSISPPTALETKLHKRDIDFCSDPTQQNLYQFNHFQTYFIHFIFQKQSSYHFYRTSYFESMILSALHSFVCGWKKINKIPKSLFLCVPCTDIIEESNYLPSFIWNQLFTILLIGLTPSNLSTRIHVILYAIQAYQYSNSSNQLPALYNSTASAMHEFQYESSITLDVYPIIFHSLCTPLFRNMIQPKHTPHASGGGIYLPAYWCPSGQTTAGFHTYSFFILQVVRYHPILSSFFNLTFPNTPRYLVQYYSLSTVDVPSSGLVITSSVEDIKHISDAGENRSHAPARFILDSSHFFASLYSSFLNSNGAIISNKQARSIVSSFPEIFLLLLRDTAPFVRQYPANQILHIAFYFYLSTYHPGQTKSFPKHSQFAFKLHALLQFRHNYATMAWNAFYSESKQHNKIISTNDTLTTNNITLSLHQNPTMLAPFEQNADPLLQPLPHQPLPHQPLSHQPLPHQPLSQISANLNYQHTTSHPALLQYKLHSHLQSNYLQFSQLHSILRSDSNVHQHDQSFIGFEIDQLPNNAHKGEHYSNFDIHSDYKTVNSNQNQLHPSNNIINPIASSVDSTLPSSQLALDFPFQSFQQLHSTFNSMEKCRTGLEDPWEHKTLQINVSTVMENAQQLYQKEQDVLINPDTTLNSRTHVDGSPFSFNTPMHLDLHIQTPLTIFEGHDLVHYSPFLHNSSVPMYETSSPHHTSPNGVKLTPEAAKSPHVSFLLHFFPELFAITDNDYNRFQPHERTTLRILARIAQLIEKDYAQAEFKESKAKIAAAAAVADATATNENDSIQTPISPPLAPKSSLSSTKPKSTTTTKGKTTTVTKTLTKFVKPDNKAALSAKQSIRLDVNEFSVTSFQLSSMPSIGISQLRLQDKLATSAAGLRLLSSSHWTGDLVEFITSCFSSQLLPYSHYTSLLPCLPISPNAVVTFESPDLTISSEPILHCRLHGSILCHIIVRYLHRIIVQRILPGIMKIDASVQRKTGPYAFLSELYPSMIYGEHSTPPLEVLGRAQTPDNESLFTSKHVLELTTLMSGLIRKFNYNQAVKGNPVVIIKWRDTLDVLIRTIMLKPAVLGWAECLLIEYLLNQMSYRETSSHYILSLFTHLRNQPHTQLFFTIFLSFLAHPGPNTFDVFAKRSICDWFLSSSFHPGLETSKHPIPPIISADDMDNFPLPFKIDSIRSIPSAKSSAYYEADSPFSYLVDYIPSLEHPKDQLQFTKLLNISTAVPVFRSITPIDISIMIMLLSVGMQPCTTQTIRNIYTEHCSIEEFDKYDPDDYDLEMSESDDDIFSPSQKPLALPSSNQLLTLQTTAQPTTAKQNISKLINSLQKKRFLKNYYIDDIQNDIAQFFSETKIQDQTYPQFFQLSNMIPKFVNIFAFYTTIYYPPPMCSTLTTVELTPEEVELIQTHQATQNDDINSFTPTAVLIEDDFTVVKFVRPSVLVYPPEQIENDYPEIALNEINNSPCQINQNFPLSTHYWSVTHALLHHPDEDLKTHIFGPHYNHILEQMDKLALVDLYKMDFHRFVEGPRYSIFFDPVQIELLSIMNTNKQVTSVHVKEDFQPVIVTSDGLKEIANEILYNPCIDLDFYDQHLFSKYYDKYISPLAIEDDNDEDDEDDEKGLHEDDEKKPTSKSHPITKSHCPPLPLRLSGEKLRSMTLGWYLINTVNMSIDDFSALLQGVVNPLALDHDSTTGSMLISPINFHVCNEYNQSLLMFAILRRCNENILTFIINHLGFDYIFKHYDVFGRNAYYYLIHSGLFEEIPNLMNHINEQKEAFLDYPPIWEKPWP